MKKLIFILAVLAVALAASCTPESIVGDEQQIDKEKYKVPPTG